MHGLRESTIGSEIILDAPDGTPRLHGSCPITFGLVGDGVSVGDRQVYGLHQTYQGSKTILDAPMVLLGDKAQVQARFGLFRDSASLDAR